jgi:uncharacterized membrane protein
MILRACEETIPEEQDRRDVRERYRRLRCTLERLEATTPRITVLEE